MTSSSVTSSFFSFSFTSGHVASLTEQTWIKILTVCLLTLMKRNVRWRQKCPHLLVGNFHLPLGNVVGSIPTPTRKSFFPCHEESRSLYSGRLPLASTTLRCR